MYSGTQLELKEAPEGFELLPDCTGAMDELEELVYEKARKKYGDVLPDEVAARISKELDMIPSESYAKYLLLRAELAASEVLSDGKWFCRASGDNSFVCYLLGVTNLDPLSRETAGFTLEPESFFGVNWKSNSPTLDINCRRTKEKGIEKALLGISWVKDVVLASSPLDGPLTLKKYVVIPEGVDMEKVPIITLDSGERVLGYHWCSFDTSKVFMVCVNGTDRLDIIAAAEEATGVHYEDMDPADPKVAAILTDKGVGLGAFMDVDSEYLTDILDRVSIHSVSDLATVFALLTSNYAWYDNLKYLLDKGVIGQDDLVASRDQCYEYLKNHGVEKEDALRIADLVRTGKPLVESDQFVLEKSDVPDWFFGFADKVRYLYPYAAAFNNAKAIWEQAYFTAHYPDEYKSVVKDLESNLMRTYTIFAKFESGRLEETTVRSPKPSNRVAFEFVQGLEKQYPTDELVSVDIQTEY